MRKPKGLLMKKLFRTMCITRNIADEVGEHSPTFFVAPTAARAAPPRSQIFRCSTPRAAPRRRRARKFFVVQPPAPRRAAAPVEFALASLAQNLIYTASK